MAERGNRGAADRAPLIERTEAGWFRGDFRTWGGKRWVLRNPDHPNWAPGKRAGRKTDVHREATEWALRYVDALEYEDLPNDEKVLDDLVDDFISYRERTTPSTAGRVKAKRRLASLRTALNHLIDDFSGRPMSDVDPQRTIDRLLREGLKPSTARTYARSSIGPFYAWMGKDIDIRLPKLSKDPRKEGVPDEKIEDVRSAAARHGMGLVFDLGLYAGLRGQEIFGVNWEDLNEGRRTLHVVRQADGTLPKSQKVREVPLLPEWSHVRAGRTGRMVEGYSEYGCETPSVRNTVRMILKEAGVYKDGTGLHLLRHTYARLLLQRTLNLHVLKDALGHSSVSVTEKYYLHVLPSTTAQAAVEMMYDE